jgi:hypothetical protein
MTGTAGLIVFVLIWSAVGYRSWVLLRRERGQRAWAYWRFLLALAFAVTLFVPAIYRAFYHLTGVPNLAELVGQGLILVSNWQGAAVLLFLAHSDDLTTARRALRIRGFLVLGTLIVITYFFVLIPAPEDTTRFTTVYADAPYITDYWIAYLFAVNLLQVDMARLFIRYSRKSTREALRLGLRIVAAGSIVGTTYWLHWMAFLVIRRTTGTTPDWLDVWGKISVITAVLLIVIGSVVPAWGRRVGLRGPVAAWREHRAWRQMQPLWEALIHEFAVELPGSTSDDAQLSYRLYRRRVEILDGILALRPYRDATAEQQTREENRRRGLTGVDLEAAVEAATLAHALKAHQAGAAIVDAPSRIAADEGATGEDAAWLARVSRHFAEIYPSSGQGTQVVR